MDYHKEKLYTFILPKIKDIKKIQILELGVREGNSTKMFIDLVEKNNGKLFSVDIDDYKNLLVSKKWEFIKSRDDNFDLITKKVKNDLDLIFLDTTHEAEHVLKIIKNYYYKLKVNGYFIIDDISWIPYLKNKKRNNFYCEINNRETFESILNLFNSNEENFDLEYSFISSGFACIKKKNTNKINKQKKIKTRKFSLKNFCRIFQKKKID